MFQQLLSGLHAAGARPLANTVAFGIRESIAAPAPLEKRQHGLEWIAGVLFELSEPILHRQDTPLPCCFSDLAQQAGQQHRLRMLKMERLAVGVFSPRQSRHSIGHKIHRNHIQFPGEIGGGTNG